MVPNSSTVEEITHHRRFPNYILAKKLRKRKNTRVILNRREYLRVNVSSAGTHFWSVTKIIPLLGSLTKVLVPIYQRQLLFWCTDDDYSLVCQTGIPLLMWRVRPYLLGVSELAVLSSCDIFLSWASITDQLAKQSQTKVLTGGGRLV